MPHRDGVAAVDRALALLAAFDGDAPSLSLSELSRATGLVKSTVLRLAASLERSGYLRRGSDARYRLGPALARLSARYQAAFQLGDHVMPALERLADATGESSAFYVRDGDQRVCLHRVNSRQHRLLHMVQVGTQFPFHTGASGRIISAFGDPDARDLQGLRSSLIAVSVGDRTISDTAALAAPVFGPGDVFVGAISLAGPASRFGEGALPRLERELLAAAASASAALGGPSSRFEERLGAEPFSSSAHRPGR